jgi:hypothetical protein
MTRCTNRIWAWRKTMDVGCCEAQATMLRSIPGSRGPRGHGSWQSTLGHSDQRFPIHIVCKPVWGEV